MDSESDTEQVKLVELDSTPKHSYEFEVKMTCKGCTGAVERVLKNTEGIDYFNVNLETQLVKVNGTISYDDLHKKLEKTGKTIVSGKILE